MSVKALFQHHRRARPGAADDALAINAQTLHPYYSTVQFDVHPEHLVDLAMARRPAAFWRLVTLLALVALAAALLV